MPPSPDDFRKTNQLPLFEGADIKERPFDECAHFRELMVRPCTGEEFIQLFIGDRRTDF